MKKSAALLVVLSFALVSGCASGGKKPGQAYIPPVPEESFSIGAYQPSKTEYNINHYDERAARAQLASVSDRFSEGDIAAIDGLKWKKTAAGWEPIPNPPVPVFEPGEDVNKYVGEYAEWIDTHPHFLFPPLPVEGKK